MAEAARWRVAVLDDYQDVALSMADWSAVQARAAVTVFNDTVADSDRLVERLRPFDVLCVMRERTPLPGAVIERLPNLKLIVSTGPKNASIDHDAARARGVAVEDTRGSLVAPMELTWGLILAAMRSIPSEAASLRAGGWQRSVGWELAGKTLGVLGLGRIGAKVARVAEAFDMKVVTWSTRLDEGEAANAGAQVVPKEEFFRTADAVSIHLVLVDATRGLVGAPELALMKPTAWLVNTSRGAIVQEAALLDALRARRIGGAALDVFDTEPLPGDHPFRTLGNVVATPHLGYVSRDQYAVFYGDTVQHVLAWMDAQAARAVA
jgi:phosphoglycerate dehydrogenase-like enzyme